MCTFAPPKLTLADVLKQHGKFRGDNPAIIQGNVKITYAEFNKRVNMVANALISWGIEKGDTVCILMLNMPEWLEIYFGILKAGAIAVPLSPMVQPDTLNLIIKDSDARAIFVSSGLESMLEAFKKEGSNLPNAFFSVNFEKEGWISYKKLLAKAARDEPCIILDDEDPVNIMYTSGTTGVPKGVVQTQRVRMWQSIGAMNAWGINWGAKSILATPLFTNLSLAIVLPTILAGGCLVIMPNFDPAELLRLILSERPTHLSMVPAQYMMILHTMTLPEFKDCKFKGILMNVVNGGAILAPQFKQQVMESFDCGLIDNYGLTEWGGTNLMPWEVLVRPSSVGKPMAGDDIRIIDDHGRELPQGEIGEIVAYGAGLMTEYYKQPEKTAEVMWFDELGRNYIKTGDIGRLDEAGYLYLLDRKKDVIISGGLNIYAGDVEQIVLENQDVLQCAVIGVPDDKWGEVPVAMVVLKEAGQGNGDEIRSLANQRLAKYQRLKDLVFVDSLPRNVLDKVLKKELRALYATMRQNDQGTQQ